MEEDIVVMSKSKRGVFLLDGKTSWFLFWWDLFICAVFTVDIFWTPLLIVWPEDQVKLNAIMHLLNFAWLFNIGFRSITIQPEAELFDSKNVFKAYLKKGFLFDILATLPSILSNNARSIFLLRLLHI